MLDLLEVPLIVSPSLPMFRDLTAEDQIALLKSSAIEIIMLRSNQSFSLEDMAWSCGGNEFKYQINDVTQGKLSLATPVTKVRHGSHGSFVAC